jgi:hypothetical protein
MSQRSPDCARSAGLRQALVLAVALGLPDAAAAQQAPPDDDTAALTLPSATAATLPAHPSTALLLEGAWTTAALRAGGSADAERVSAELSTDERFAPDWRFVFGDRLDVDWAGSWRESAETNTLKQAYLSWQPGSALLLDAGRINARQGVAYGYNPTDFLRANAVRSVDSLDPNSLRDERLGTVMVRAEDLWASGAVTALYAPGLAAMPSSAPFSPDWGATNGVGHWMLSLSQTLSSNLSPQWLLFGTNKSDVRGSAVQAGVDLTTLLGSSVVAYLEASGGRIPSLWSEALGVSGHTALRGRAAAGFTVTAANKLSVTFEYEYDGAAFGARAWNAARSGSLESYGLYRNFVLAQQELPTQQAVFVYAAWQDVLLRHLDATALLRVDVLDHSRIPWTELRHHWAHVDAALRWQDYSGGATTDFGAAPTSRTWQVVLDYYF